MTRKRDLLRWREDSNAIGAIRISNGFHEGCLISCAILPTSSSKKSSASRTTASWFPVKGLSAKTSTCEINATYLPDPFGRRKLRHAKWRIRFLSHPNFLEIHQLPRDTLGWQLEHLQEASSSVLPCDQQPSNPGQETL